MLAAITGACADANPTGVAVPKQPAHSASIAATAWTGSGPGTFTVFVDSAGDTNLRYEFFTPPPNTLVTWDLETTADQTATVTQPWSYTGEHSAADSTLVYAIVNDAVVATLFELGTARGFDVSGTYTFTVSAGDTYGFRFGSKTGSLTALHIGTFTVDLPEAPVDPVTKDDCKDGGWMTYGFRNQGQCVDFVETGNDSR
jgi:hypothetical protein